MSNDYKSPLKKLVKFFESSRDKWKEKAIQRKKDLKRLKNRIAFLESSKQQLKEENRNFQSALQKMMRSHEHDSKKK